jgi:hypothetical protein
MKKYKTKHKIIEFGVKTSNGNIYTEGCRKDTVGEGVKLVEGVPSLGEKIDLNRFLGEVIINDDLTGNITLYSGMDELYLKIVESIKNNTFEDEYRIVLTICGEVEKVGNDNIVTKINNIECANLVSKEDSSWEKE